MNAAIENYMEKSKEMNSQLRRLMAGGSFEDILTRSRALRKKMETSLSNSQSKYNELMNQVNAKTQKNSNADRFREKKDEILGKDKNEIEQFEGLAKSRLDTIKFKKLPKVQFDSEVNELFTFLFMYLYNEPESNFEFKEFVKFALKKNVDEFKKRLAKFEVENIGKEGLKRLEMVGDA